MTLKSVNTTLSQDENIDSLSQPSQPTQSSNDTLNIVKPLVNYSQIRAKTRKTALSDDYNLLFKLAYKGLKYLLLALLGIVIAYIVSTVFEAVPIVKMLLSPNLWQWFVRIGVFIFCMFAIAIIFESSR